MYRNEKWQDDVLYIQSSPNGPWREATAKETITHLRVRALELEQAVLDIRAQSRIDYEWKGV